MNKGLIGTFTLLAIAFLAITYVKYTAGSEEEVNNQTQLEKPAKSEVINFWNTFHKATDLRTSGDFRDAAELYAKALQAKPEHQNSLYYLGNMKLALQEYEEAEKAWKKLLSVNPQSSRGHAQLGMLYSCPAKENRLYNLDHAVEQYNQSIHLNPEETGPLLQQAKINLVRGNLGEAGNQLNDVTMSNFRSDEALFLQGYLAWKKDQIKKAESLLTEALSIVEGTTDKKNVGEGETSENSPDLERKAGQCDILSDHYYSLIRQAIQDTIDRIEIYKRFNERIADRRSR